MAGKIGICANYGEPRTYSDLPEEEVYPHQAPAMNLIDSISEPHRNQSPATLGVAAMEVIEAACLSAKSGNNVHVASLLLEQPI